MPQVSWRISTDMDQMKWVGNRKVWHRKTMYTDINETLSTFFFVGTLNAEMKISKRFWNNLKHVQQFDFEILNSIILHLEFVLYMRRTFICGGSLYAADLYMRRISICDGSLYAADRYKPAELYMRRIFICGGSLFAADRYSRRISICGGSLYAADLYMRRIFICGGSL